MIYKAFFIKIIFKKPHLILLKKANNLINKKFI